MTYSEQSLDAIVTDLFDTVARHFPVSCASDEFYYFPQVRLPHPIWKRWDDFSPDLVSEVIMKLSSWKSRLDTIRPDEREPDVQTDSMILRKLVVTLHEQLSDIRPWEYQPTLYLTIASLGLAEAIESEDSRAAHERAETLPAFFDHACRNLKIVPVLFRDIALEMISDTRTYMMLLEKRLPELKNTFSALDRFEDALLSLTTRNDFLLPDTQFERIVGFHIFTESSAKETNDLLDLEIDEMKKRMNREAKRFVPHWTARNPSFEELRSALNQIPLPEIGANGLIGLYQEEVDCLADHCVEQGFLSSDVLSSYKVSVAPVPLFLSAIRSSSSYSIPLKYPPSGGTFHIVNAQDFKESQKEYHRDYRMLSAHETWPGHHLLDIHRLNHTRPLRRAFEQPIFYEGWACFAEELLLHTGYFSAPQDRFLLAKRRLWRALRGKVDLGIQTGTLDMPAAARYLSHIGMSYTKALSTVKKYTLQPGYQLCYTIGLQRFLRLSDHYGKGTLKQFVKTVLNQGEILFSDLYRICFSDKNYRDFS
ncbi:MAG: DUF885 family protein [Nitrospiraceae bacterium]|nr:MAG: DUF885 family protein [Nitrospiraceae bacterium]